MAIVGRKRAKHSVPAARKHDTGQQGSGCVEAAAWTPALFRRDDSRLDPLEPNALSIRQADGSDAARPERVVDVLRVGCAAPYDLNRRARVWLGEIGLPEQRAVAVRIDRDDEATFVRSNQNAPAVGQRLKDRGVAEIPVRSRILRTLLALGTISVAASGRNVVREGLIGPQYLPGLQ